MAGCCSRQGYDEFFTEKIARRDARSYRRRGLDENARRIVGFVVRRGVRGATVLDVGGGNGTLGLELLKAGAARVITVELSSSYDETAMELAREAGAQDRVERRTLDFADAADLLPEADVVVMHRVVCCYPDGEALVAAAAAKARRLLAFSVPRRTWWTRLGAVLLNVFLALRKMEYRSFVHRPERLVAAAERYGLRETYEHDGPLWRIAGFDRPRSA
ncbi:MAG TPA: methyltransferase domain-containing protein [Gaiellaceae bacterium]